MRFIETIRTPQDLPPWLYNVVFPVNHWLHLVATTLLVGGVLFFEFVVPLATEDLLPEQQFSVFGRARWVFRRVARLGVVLLLITGALALWRTWHIYSTDEAQVQQFWFCSKPWVLGHILFGAVAFAALLRVTNTARIRGHPVGWMRAILVILFSCMFMASVARQISLKIHDWHDENQRAPNAVHDPPRF